MKKPKYYYSLISELVYKIKGKRVYCFYSTHHWVYSCCSLEQFKNRLGITIVPLI